MSAIVIFAYGCAPVCLAIVWVRVHNPSVVVRAIFTALAVLETRVGAPQVPLSVYAQSKYDFPVERSQTP